MGIRIHKNLGYGLQNIKFTKYAVSDSRFNLVDGYFADKNKFSMEGYLEFLKNKSESQTDEYERMSINVERHTLSDGKVSDFYDAIEYDAEFGKKVVVFAPLGIKWRRYADEMDHYDECATFGDGMQPRVTLLKDGIYPYVGIYVDIRNGKRLTREQTQYYCMYHWKVEKRVKTSSFLKLKYLMGDAIVTEKDLKFIQPEVPIGIVLMCEYLKMFSDPLTVWKLKPMIYVHWS